MKKLLSLILALLMISSFAVMFASCSCGEPEVFTTGEGKTFHRNWDTIVTYKLDGQNVNAQVNEDKNLALQGIFLSMTERKKKPDCKFTEDFMVTMNGEQYFVAQDGCPIIKHNDKYYNTSVSDRMILNSIFKNYGAVDIFVKEEHR